MRQTLALLLVLALVGTVLAANAGREIPERRRKEMAKKYSTMQRVKSLDPGSRMDLRRTQELAQKAGLDGLRGKFNDFKAPNADELNKIRNRMTAGGAMMAAQMNIRNLKGMKKSMRKPVF